MMYSAAMRLTPEDIYDASRMAFLEMALSGITTVGEFHYIHHAPEGNHYDDPNLMAKMVIEAARDVGLRIALLRVAYARSGYRVEPNARQTRFIEAAAETFLRNVESLQSELERGRSERAWVGIAPHSVRAVPLDYLREVARYSSSNESMPIHMHVAEQPAEITACLEEHGRTPVELLDDAGLLNERFTGVHGIHITKAEARSLAKAQATICACPTTERNLGDGIVPAEMLFAEGVRISLGTDSHAQIDLLEDARELEYHLRLTSLRRNVLAPGGGDDAGDESLAEGRPEAVSAEAGGMSALAARLFECATASGAQSLGFDGGELRAGAAADFFTVDLDDPSIAGASREDLLACVVFSLSRAAVRDVAVGGRLVVEDGRHPAQDETVARFRALQKKLWG
jgi:formimidoylglutamate deiminase